MFTFKVYIKSIHCNSITDSLLEGAEDELYLRVWHKDFNNIFPKQEISLGNFTPGKKVDINRIVFDRQFPEIDSLCFDFYDSDKFSSDDLLGGFTLSPKNIMKVGPDTKYTHEKNNMMSSFQLIGHGSDYVIEATFQTA